MGREVGTGSAEITGVSQGPRFFHRLRCSHTLRGKDDHRLSWQTRVFQPTEKKSRPLWRRWLCRVLGSLIVPKRSGANWSHGFAFLGIF